MCLAIPGEVLEILPDRPDLAKVEVSGVRRNINISLLGRPPEPGDWILIHVGFALSTIDESEAREVLEFLEGLGQSYTDEIDALQQSRIE
ncbi:HypC/HybG/HupF family hydrogenase formation chaperone [Saccharopolyspora sp. NPDC050389]|uniref:HypC/HybG/HupF family hydrogenase formation chaperone n=1 Tax=Saccharopolyspora sp. NPDC050389 TaxID=3155516 RepID=UPI00340E1AED